MAASERDTPADVILAIDDPYMQQIIDGTKTVEFRKYDMVGIERIWFYRNAPHSAITHVCEVAPAVDRRDPAHAPLPEDGLGNAEYNQNHPDTYSKITRTQGDTSRERESKTMGFNVINENARINSNVPTTSQPTKQEKMVMKKENKGQLSQKDVSSSPTTKNYTWKQKGKAID